MTGCEHRDRLNAILDTIEARDARRASRAPLRWAWAVTLAEVAAILALIRVVAAR